MSHNKISDKASTGLDLALGPSQQELEVHVHLIDDANPILAVGQILPYQRVDALELDIFSPEEYFP